MYNFWVIFLTGLTVGGFSCLAIQGGLLISLIAKEAKDDLNEGVKVRTNFLRISIFVTAKIIAYTLLGFLIGIFGNSLVIGEGTRAWMQILAGGYMVGVALYLFNHRTFFRYISFLRLSFKIVKNQSITKNITSGLIGAFTVFIPCGTTLAIESLAVSSGNPIQSALIMFAFILGTTPLFLSLGYLTFALSDFFKVTFLKIAAVGLLFLGVVAINESLNVLNFPVTLEKAYEYSPIQIDLSGSVDVS